jgi:hypothetical protein
MAALAGQTVDRRKAARVRAELQTAGGRSLK